MDSVFLRTRPDRRGGTTPFWDEQMHFEVYDTTPWTKGPPSRRLLHIACYATDKEPDYIGQGSVEVQKALRHGEQDQWVSLYNQHQFCGQVYVELTYYSLDPPPTVKGPGPGPIRTQSMPVATVAEPPSFSPRPFVPSPPASPLPANGSSDTKPPSTAPPAPTLPRRVPPVPSSSATPSSAAITPSPIPPPLPPRAWTVDEKTLADIQADYQSEEGSSIEASVHSHDDLSAIIKAHESMQEQAEVHPAASPEATPLSPPLPSLPATPPPMESPITVEPERGRRTMFSPTLTSPTSIATEWSWQRRASSASQQRTTPRRYVAPIPPEPRA